MAWKVRGRGRIASAGCHGQPPRQGKQVIALGGHRLSGGLAGFAGNAILTFLILFFVFRDGHTAIENATSLLPLSRDQAGRLLTGIRDSVVANLRDSGGRPRPRSANRSRVSDPPRTVSVAARVGRCRLLPHSDRGNNLGLAARCYLPHGHRSSLERAYPDPVGRARLWWARLTILFGRW